MATRTFTRAPSSLPLLVKAVLPAVPLIGRLPGIRHVRRELPDLVLERRDVTIDAARLDAYRELCGFPDTELVPVTYPHVEAFGLHLALMTDTSFPLTPLGLVHLRSSITQHRPLRANEVLDLTVRPERLRPHPKGSLVDLATHVSVDGEAVWDETMTLLSRHVDGGPETEVSPLAGAEAPSGTVRWSLGDDLGRRYASVSGDRNPIHLHPLTAKVLGFDRAVAHGMWTLSRSVSALQNSLPDAFRIDAELRRPILLPTQVMFGSSRSEASTVFGVRDEQGSTTHLVGRIVPIDV